MDKKNGHDIIINLRKIWCEGMMWIKLARDTMVVGSCRTVMNLWFPRKARNFLTSRATITLRKTVLN
jgi:hypothetical protein